MQSVDIETQSGRIRGNADAHARRWLGIPYAAPPEGALRWQPAQPHAGWTGVRDTLRAGAISLQHASQMTAELPGGLDSASEDCLTLNVFAPLHPVDQKLPVMVWIHGGGFSIGSGAQALYDGARMADEQQVIVVTLNYRLGVLGFLRLQDVTNGAIASSGNEGLLDQVAALRWVRDNIGQFGGDAGNVTAFGESAGAMSVATLLTMPAARGLIHRAILQSGGAHAVHDVARANHAAELFVQQMPARVQRDPRLADATQLVAAARTLHGRMMFDERLSIMPTRPVIDGEIVTQLPMQAMRDGQAAQVPVLIGSNRDEWRYFMPVDRGIARLDHDGLIKRLQYNFGDDEIAGLLDVYGYDPDAPDSAVDTYCEITGDGAFVMPGLFAAQALSASQPAYVYRFDHPAPGLGGRLGACHYSEVAYVFGTLDAPGSGVLFGNDATSQAVSARMRGAWAAFARNGDPGISAWKPLDQTSGRYHFAAEDDYRALDVAGRMAFWETIGDKRLQAL